MRERRFRVWILVALAWTFIPLAHGQVVGTYGKKIDAILDSYHRNGWFQGAVLVALDDHVIYRKAFGSANVELDVPNTPETRFAAASLGKSFTAALILQLVDEGKLSLDDPLSKHLPTYGGDRAESITIHQLLAHTAGIPWPQDDWPPELFTKSYALDELVGSCAENELVQEPGSAFNYCNCCYHVAAAIVEQKTGAGFEAELKRRILDPLGMRDTGIVRLAPVIKGRASGYTRRDDGSLANAAPQDQSYALGAGGIYTTVDDMYRWDRALYGDAVLSAASRERMFTADENGAGYAWNVGGYGKKGVEGRRKLATGYGGTEGFASLVARLMGDRYFIVVLGNLREIPQGRLANDLWNTILGFDVDLEELERKNRE